MRIPGSSETKAFHLAIGVALLSGVAILAGVVLTSLYGIAVFGVGLLVALAVELFSKDPERRRPDDQRADVAAPPSNYLVE